LKDGIIEKILIKNLANATKRMKMKFKKINLKQNK
jgi:hypothetical protein